MLKSTQFPIGKTGEEMKWVKNLGIAKLISWVHACIIGTMSMGENFLNIFVPTVWPRVSNSTIQAKSAP